MSLRIPCPTCGPLPIDHWVHGEIPVVPDTISDPDGRDVDRAYMHNNEHGVVREAWFCLGGCRRWVTLWRDTGTDTFVDPPSG
ncbi:MAG: sarcosine oxidase subunit delta [Actinomycetota bacterium]